jgi:hypothetical protein
MIFIWLFHAKPRRFQKIVSFASPFNKKVFHIREVQNPILSIIIL